jgi:hypothetical protein
MCYYLRSIYTKKMFSCCRTPSDTNVIDYICVKVSYGMKFIFRVHKYIDFPFHLFVTHSKLLTPGKKTYFSVFKCCK